VPNPSGFGKRNRFSASTHEAARTLGAPQPLSWGWVSAIDSNGRTIWIADAHRDEGKRFVVRADEMLTAFVELESGSDLAERPEDCGTREIKVDKLSLDHSAISSIPFPSLRL
jgi:hypothetical protein